MPELPEAEVSRRTLAPVVVGRRIAGVTVVMPTRLSRPVKDPEGFAAALKGRRIAGLERRGKDLLFRLDDGAMLDLNLGLWASVTLWDHPPVKGETPRLGLVLELEPAEAPGLPVDGQKVPSRPFLVVADVTFARWGVYPYEPPAAPPPYDAASPELTTAVLASVAEGPARRARTVKALLMDDRALLGIGNGYADEILWRARLHPLRAPASLDGREWEALAGAIPAELELAVAEGGESGYLDANGRPGRRERPIHHHAGDPCPRCATALEGYVKGGRETDYCPVCQPVPTV